MKKEAFPAIILGLFSSSRKQDDLELLPPPPPFPGMDILEEEPAQEAAPQKRGQELKEEKAFRTRTKITIKRPREDAEAILRQAGSAGQGEPIPVSVGEEDKWLSEVPQFDLAEDNSPYSEDSFREINTAIDSTKQPVQEKQGFLRRLFSPKKKGPSESTAPSQDLPAGQDALAEEMPFPENQADETEIERVTREISEARQMVMDLDLVGAKKSYVDIMKSYRLMTPDEQKQVYGAIRGLYDERKTAESMHLK